MKREYNLVIEDNHCDCPKNELLTDKELSSIDIDELFNFDYSKKFASEKYQELDTLLELIKLEMLINFPNIRLHLNLQEQQHYHYQNMQYHLIKLNSILQLF